MKTTAVVRKAFQPWPGNDWLAALGTVGWMVSVALSKDPLGFFVDIHFSVLAAGQARR